ncbi:YjjG family noncanonical pyrimidine nucleotidase [Cesiribacter sp. SM1]|uniref:YjjG family noncanonical pyrimidine nucleotidase n=1 Tax=Cesiribacter sp. SM1 TaxID=2861196 RepID=UPI001CD59C9F|nr:YjjG family noncanonical pyrimidine nucleotidase [Cesiribacter sp. SM1]
MRQLKTTYKFLFFDLDHTLWDYTSNSEETLRELYEKYGLAQVGNFCTDTFCQTFDKVNRQLWSLNEAGALGRDELRRQRFVRVLEALGNTSVPEWVSEGLDRDYMSICPAKGGLLPYAREVLEHCHKRFPMYVLTNGFRDVQDIKLEAAGINHFFDGIFTAEDAGVSKPNTFFFEYVLRKVGAKPQECLMVGDNLKADIIGAASAGIDSVYYNPYRRKYNVPVQRDIHCLSELLTML